MAMAVSANMRDQWIANNRQEYGERYAALKFLSPAEARQATARRRELLRALEGRATIGCSGTKLDCSNLSPGCRICGAGGWSCLFINGRCNGRCFYCPSSQNETGLPTTNTVDFHSPADYVAYLERFGFTGVGISGGEPLLTPQRTVAFIRAVKKHFGASLHVWLYTNGTLVDSRILGQLRDAGLDEIRFDIGATEYRLDKLRLATGVIPIVTVEIPAVPEEAHRLKAMMLEMRDAGVLHLNLHQLRLTPYNFPRLVTRPYTYLHGEKVTVLESEQAALELLYHALDQGVDLPVNYCSFVYKKRYQGLAARRRNAQVVIKAHEEVTDNGYIRTLTLTGDPTALARQTDVFRAQGIDKDLWNMTSSRKELAFHPCLWRLVDFTGLRVRVRYSASRQRSGISYYNPFVEVRISDTKTIIVERGQATPDRELSDAAIVLFAEHFLDDASGIPKAPPIGILAELAGFERIAEGLQSYF